MKILKRFFIYLFFIAAGLIVLIYIYFEMQKPIYSGTQEITNLKADVTVYFDNYGVPHIYGDYEEDIFRVLGYLNAKERMFQMELIRRVTSGRLSEVFGNKTLKVDKFFRMLGLHKKAEASARDFMLSTDTTWKKDMLAYLDGVNEYIDRRRKRFEFLLLGIPKEKYTITDLYLIVDYLAFNFQMGFKTDPLLTKINQKWGDKYLADIGIQNGQNEYDTTGYLEMDTLWTEIEKALPFKIWTGSNSWAVSAERSKSGKVLFENDTHIGVQQPAPWYEAHLNSPGFNFYGSFLAGFPFAPLGHSLHHAWGVTILENDDLDFFTEHVKISDTNYVMINNRWENIQTRIEVIHVKDSSDIILHCRSTSHGPICSDVMSEFARNTYSPVSICWTFLKFPDNLPEVAWKFAHSKSMEEFRGAVSLISAPGLNIIYADSEDNIAWYSAAKFVKRKNGINPNLILDGFGANDWEGFYDFSVNPKVENPVRGVVLSANNPPLNDSLNWFPGYYVPPDRMVRINQLFHSKKVFDLSDMQQMNTDVINPLAQQITQVMLSKLPATVKVKSQTHERVNEILDRWSGSHNLEDIAPVIYYKWLYNTLRLTFIDELEEKDFTAFLKTHAQKSSVLMLMQNENSVWWDNVNTKYVIEKESNILSDAYNQTITELINQLGPNPEKWIWKKVHYFEINHPIGEQKPLNEIFNIGPYPQKGGMETINNQSFELNGSGLYKVNLAPALRRTIDFADPENAYSVSPSGQSGNFMSHYYNDQTKLYVNGRVRKEMMNTKEIQSTYNSKLEFKPPQ